MRPAITFDNVDPKPLYNWRPEYGFGAEDHVDKRVSLYPTQLATRLVRLRDGGGMPFTVKDQPYLMDIYDPWPNRLLLIFGRQTGKSTAIANFVFVPAVCIKGYRSLVVNPTDTHTRTFAYDKLDGTLAASPYLERALGRPRVDNLYHREYRNGSSILLRSAYLTARSSRGIAADQLNVDEAQEMIPGHIPVLQETLQHSHQDEFGRRIVISGTALTTECLLGEYWERHSTQGEWVMQCNAGHDNVIELENITERGLQCTNVDNAGVGCGRDIPMQPMRGHWVHAFPSRKKAGGYVGFRVPQVITPMSVKHWRTSVTEKLRTYSNKQIQNEMLARSYDGGARPITRDQLLRAELKNTPISTSQNHISEPIIGMDWGYGDVSYSVLTVGGWNQHREYQIIYAKKFKLGDELEPSYQIDYITHVFKQFNCIMIGADWGAGWGSNAHLKAKFKNRFQEFLHSHGLKTAVKYSRAINRYVVNRTDVMSRYFEAIKRNRVKFYSGYVEEFCADYLNIVTTQDSLGRVLYQHSPSKPDDAVHSALFGFLIASIMHREIIPVMDDDPTFV